MWRAAPRRRGPALVAAALAAVALLSACTGSGRDENRRGACRHGCRGVLDKAAYEIRVPAHWNGTLVLYSHGYTSPASGTAGGAQIAPSGNNGPVAAALLSRGFAVAGSSYAAPGWVVREAVDDASRLYRKFVDVVARPARVYAWGSSMGGLVTELVAERYDWVSGAAPMCGVVGGPLANADNMLEAVVATQALFATKLTTGNVTAFVSDVLGRAVRSGGSQQAKILYLGYLLGISPQARGATGTVVSSPVAAMAGNLGEYLIFGIGLLHDLAARFGGNPASSPGPSHRPGLTGTERDRITRLGGDPDRYAEIVQAASSVHADPDARAALNNSGNPTGRLRVPTITLHTVADSYVLPGNESLFRSRVATADRLDRLLQLYVGPPSSSGSAPYGLGHCAFSATQMTGLLDTLDRWVRSGHRPSAASVVGALRPALAANFTAPRFPTDAR